MNIRDTIMLGAMFQKGGATVQLHGIYTIGLEYQKYWVGETDIEKLDMRIVANMVEGKKWESNWHNYFFGRDALMVEFNEWIDGVENETD